MVGLRDTTTYCKLRLTGKGLEQLGDLEKVRLRRLSVKRIIEGWPVRKVEDRAQAPLRTVYSRCIGSRGKEGRGLTRPGEHIEPIPLTDDAVERVVAVRMDMDGVEKPYPPI
jgi:hypothetical protein